MSVQNQKQEGSRLPVQDKEALAAAALQVKDNPAAARKLVELYNLKPEPSPAALTFQLVEIAHTLNKRGELEQFEEDAKKLFGYNNWLGEVFAGIGGMMETYGEGEVSEAGGFIGNLFNTAPPQLTAEQLAAQARAEAEEKRRRTNTILIIGGGTIVFLIIVILITRKREG